MSLCSFNLYGLFGSNKRHNKSDVGVQQPIYKELNDYGSCQAEKDRISAALNIAKNSIIALTNNSECKGYSDKGFDESLQGILRTFADDVDNQDDIIRDLLDLFNHDNSLRNKIDLLSSNLVSQDASQSKMSI